ncbi:hypothetical protein F4781DRAFT_418771 [Annulohypoxylon bovei var. microspora]|nr:hypothetical protein F4781DRAFT_418771 [Annulohypoxylon bovei var. microspora]
MVPQLSTAPLSEEELAKDQSPQLLVIFIVFTVLPLIAVTLRIVARRATHQEIWYDDWLIIVSVALCVVQLALLIEALRYGLGKHAQVVPPTSIEPYLLYTYLSELYYAIDVTLIKLSILTLYLRLFNVNRRFKKSCYAMMVFVLAWGIAVIFTTIFQCTPIPAAWDKTIPAFKCFNLAAFIIGSNVPNILADTMIIALPIPMLWNLKLSLLRKLGLIALFLVAAVTTVISLLRCIYNSHIDPKDATWNFITVAILSTVEVSVGVCCACMPVIYPLFRLLSGRRIASKTRTSSNDPRYPYDRHSSRMRQRLASSDQEPSDTDQLWSTSASVNGFPKEGREIPMNRIMVTLDLSVWPPPRE